MRQRILWLDQDWWFLESYVDALRYRGFDVVMEPDGSAVFVVGETFPYTMVIWDLWLSPDDSDALRAPRGCPPGPLLIARLQRRHPNVPTLLFTNHKPVAVEWNAPQQRRFALAKRDVLPDDFASGVEAILR